MSTAEAAQHAPIPGNLVSFDQFWPHYVRLHADRKTRGWHLAGTALGLLTAIVATVQGRWWLLGVAVVVAYGLAWIGHLLEGHRPASLKHPLWSLRADLRMSWLTVLGRTGNGPAHLHTVPQDADLRRD